MARKWFVDGKEVKYSRIVEMARSIAPGRLETDLESIHFLLAEGYTVEYKETDEGRE